MKTYHYPSARADKRLAAICGRAVSFSARDVRAVARIIDAVRKQGDAALVDYTRRFDAAGFSADQLRVSAAEFENAEKALTPEFAETLDRAIAHITDFHQRQKAQSWIVSDRPGVLLGQMVRPVDAAGVYVPGGQGGNTPLVSSVLMGCLPARIAGVQRVCVVTPPTPDGGVHPYILAAARRVGVDEVYKTGSAWAVAALAYGTETIAAVDVIVGPGNIYVTVAKKLVAGMVGIDMIAGPSEVLVIADHTADPDHIAADLLSQAEHDPLAASILVTTSRRIARDVKKALEVHLDSLSRKDIARTSLDRNGAVFVVEDTDRAVDLANRIAPEHLELLVEDPMDTFLKIRHAGAVFLGPYTPEPVGDYLAGPNHVLPTAGAARFSSPLSVDHFVKKTSLLQYTRAAFEDEAPHVIRLAETEGLTAHANAVRARLSGK